MPTKQPPAKVVGNIVPVFNSQEKVRVDVSGRLCRHCGKSDLVIAARQNNLVAVVIGESTVLAHKACEEHAFNVELAKSAAEAKSVEFGGKLAPAIWEELSAPLLVPKRAVLPMTRQRVHAIVLATEHAPVLVSA